MRRKLETLKKQLSELQTKSELQDLKINSIQQKLEAVETQLEAAKTLISEKRVSDRNERYKKWLGGYPDETKPKKKES